MGEELERFVSCRNDSLYSGRCPMRLPATSDRMQRGALRAAGESLFAVNALLISRMASREFMYARQGTSPGPSVEHTHVDRFWSKRTLFRVSSLSVILGFL